MKTREVAEELGVTGQTLLAAMSRNKFPRPRKDASDEYVWTAEDVERAKAGMAVDKRRKVGTA
jgi:predicted DNA-binding transcriptional regulator AlpA